MDLQKAREKFAEINLKHGFYTQEELKFTDLGVFECTAAEQDFDMWWECLIYYAQPLIDQKEKALLEQFEINNKLVEQVEKLKAQAVPEWISTSERMPDHGEFVLILAPACEGTMFVGIRDEEDDNFWYDPTDMNYLELKYAPSWMPLPDAPQEPTND